MAHASNAGATDAALATMGDTSVSATSVRESDASGSHALVSVALAAPGYAAASASPDDVALARSGSLVIGTADVEVEISNGASASSGLNDYLNDYRRRIDAWTPTQALDNYHNLQDAVAQAAQRGAASNTGETNGKYIYLWFSAGLGSQDTAAKQVQEMIASLKSGALSSAQGFSYVGTEYSITGVVGNKDAALGGVIGAAFGGKSFLDAADKSAQEAYCRYSDLAPAVGDLVNEADQGGIGFYNSGQWAGELTIPLDAI